MAAQTASAALLPGTSREGEDLGFVATTGNVIRTRTMATLATLMRGAAFRVERRFPMGCFSPIVVELLVTGLAGLRPYVLGGVCRRRTGGSRGGGWSTLMGSVLTSAACSRCGAEK